MADHKMDLIRNFQADLMGFLPETIAQHAADLLTVRLQNYDISESRHELIVRETESEQMLRNFLATKKIEGRSDLTIERYADQLHKMMAAIGKPTREICIYDLRSYLASLGLRGLQATSVAGVRSIISSFFSWLTNEGILNRNPAAQLAPIKTPDVIKYPFSATDLDKLRSACKGKERDRAIVEFLRASGCRISEVTRLDRDAINSSRMEVEVLGKGNKRRTVYLDDVCMMHLEAYLRKRTDMCDALFVNTSGKRMTPHGIREMLTRLGDAAGVENVHPHRFRRTLATNLAVRGMPVQDIARILGHSNIDTTMVYVSMNDANVKMSYKRYSA